LARDWERMEVFTVTRAWGIYSALTEVIGGIFGWVNVWVFGEPLPKIAITAFSFKRHFMFSFVFVY